MRKLSPQDKAWETRRKFKKIINIIECIIKKLEEKIESDLKSLWKSVQKENNIDESKLKEILSKYPSESHLQADLYPKLKKELPKEWYILIEPTITALSKKKSKGKAKNIPPFIQPDILITPYEDIGIEKRNKKPKHSVVRISINRKKSIAIEITLQKPRLKKDFKYSKYAIDYAKIRKIKNEYNKKENFGKVWHVYVNLHPLIGKSNSNIPKLSKDVKLIGIGKK